MREVTSNPDGERIRRAATRSVIRPLRMMLAGVEQDMDTQGEPRYSVTYEIESPEVTDSGASGSSGSDSSEPSGDGADQSVSHLLREDGAQRVPSHLLREVPRIVARLRTERDAATHPQGAAPGSGPGAARTLLSPGLGVGAGKPCRRRCRSVSF